MKLQIVILWSLCITEFHAVKLSLNVKKIQTTMPNCRKNLAAKIRNELYLNMLHNAKLKIQKFPPVNSNVIKYLPKIYRNR